MKKQHSVTTLPLSPTEERHRRMIRYSIAMGIRLICFVMIFFVHGWWLAVVAVGAIILPYIAVIIANVSMVERETSVERPGAIVHSPSESQL